MTPLQGHAHHLETIFLSEILILVSSISYLFMVKKPECFFDGKNSIFQNDRVENFKTLEILQSKRDFYNFLQAIIEIHSCY